MSRLLVANIMKTDIIVSVTNDPLEKKKSWGLFCLKPQSFLDLFLIICLKVSRNFLLKGFNLILDVFNWLLFLARGNTHGYSFWCLFWILAGWCWNVLCCGIYEQHPSYLSPDSFLICEYSCCDLNPINP